MLSYTLSLTSHVNLHLPFRELESSFQSITITVTEAQPYPVRARLPKSAGEHQLAENSRCELLGSFIVL